MTLVETLLAAGIGALLVGVLTSAVFQFVIATEQGNSRFTTLHDVQNAGYWISVDGQEAQSVDLVEGMPAKEMTLSWSSRGQDHEVRYYLVGSELKREHDDTTTTVARHISVVKFSVSGRVIQASLTSSAGDRWEEEADTTISVLMRPSSSDARSIWGRQA